MYQREQLEHLLADIMSIHPQLGDNTSLVGAGAAGIGGITTTASDVVLQLQRSAVEFAKACMTNDGKALAVAHKDLIAKIMVTQTLETISQERADSLLDKVQRLVKEKE